MFRCLQRCATHLRAQRTGQRFIPSRTSYQVVPCTNSHIHIPSRSYFHSIFTPTLHRTPFQPQVQVHSHSFSSRLTLPKKGTALPRRSIFIQTDTTPNPQSLKFLPGKEIMSNGTMNFPSSRSANISPLAKKLFSIEGVTGVFFGKDFITVTKDEDYGWPSIKQIVSQELMEFFQSGAPIILEVPPNMDTEILPDDSEVVASIKEIINDRVRPAVQEDGGDIVYRGFEDGVVFLKMQGSCSGCPSSSVTLTQGIEKMLKHWVPEGRWRHESGNKWSAVTHVMAIDDDELDKINTEQFIKTEKKIKEQSKTQS